jgi:hypothetical protein
MKSKSKSKMSKLYSFEEKLADLGLEYYIHSTIIQNEGRDMWYMDDTTATINPLTKEQTLDLKRKIHKYFPELKIKFNEKNFSRGFTVYKKDIDWETVDEKKYGELLGFICPVNNLYEMVKTSENKFGGGINVIMKNKHNVDIFGEWCFVENPDSVKQKYEDRINKITVALQKDSDLWKLIDKVEGGTSGTVFHNSTYYIKKLRTLESFSKSEKSDILGNCIGSYAAKQLQDYKYQWQNPKHREILYEIIDKINNKNEWVNYVGDNDEQTIENMKVWEAPYLKRLDDSWSFWYIF